MTPRRRRWPAECPVVEFELFCRPQIGTICGVDNGIAKVAGDNFIFNALPEWLRPLTRSARDLLSLVKHA